MTNFEKWKGSLTVENAQFLFHEADCEACPAYNTCKCGIDADEELCYSSFGEWAGKENIEETKGGILLEDGNSYMCCLHETPRTFDWCEKHCGKYFGCDTVATANDEYKERFGD